MPPHPCKPDVTCPPANDRRGHPPAAASGLRLPPSLSKGARHYHGAGANGACRLPSTSAAALGSDDAYCRPASVSIPNRTPSLSVTCASAVA
ncbi:hypothetical protein BDY21DRAFT_344298 [Lineolata rhizophorae]|uniref:Uncharacterized protein n=1 Tax=Lineolata rhizophorae TaxID=578093 RepID=A0A6A6P1G2_9PEZI|nr:hypothetical protein BDY21DRAFT_344298 [Lineolata rhizophorae]